MLYNKNESEWQNNFPSKIPNFINSNLSAYNFANQGKPLSTYPHSFFAPHLIEKIKNAKKTNKPVSGATETGDFKRLKIKFIA